MACAQVLDGLDLDADFKGLDVLPILSPPEALEHINTSQPMRLKLNGRVKFSGGMDHSDEKSSFVGDLSLDNLRVNQLKLTRNLTGLAPSPEEPPVKSHTTQSCHIRLWLLQLMFALWSCWLL